MFVFPDPSDSGNYISGAQELLNGEYLTYRPPVFSIFIVPFLFFAKEPILAVNLTSFTCGVLLIICSYFVFEKASLKLFCGEGAETKAKYVGLGVSFFVTFNYYLIYTNGRGLREEAISLLLLLSIYYVFIHDDKLKKKYVFIISILMVLLTLIHISVGLLFLVSTVLYFIGSKIKLFKKKISNKKFALVFAVISLSYGFWMYISFLRFDDPFNTFAHKQWWYYSNTELDLFSLEGIVTGFFLGFEVGILFEFQELARYIGLVILLTVILSALYYHRQPQIQFLTILVLVNFLLLSVFMAAAPNIRLLVYFFPILFYIGFLFLSNILYHHEDRVLYEMHIFNIGLKIRVKSIFILFLIFFLLSTLLKFAAYIFYLEILLNMGNLAFFLCEILLFLTITLALFPSNSKKIDHKI